MRQSDCNEPSNLPFVSIADANSTIDEHPNPERREQNYEANDQDFRKTDSRHSCSPFTFTNENRVFPPEHPNYTWFSQRKQNNRPLQSVGCLFSSMMIARSRVVHAAKTASYKSSDFQSVSTIPACMAAVGRSLPQVPLPSTPGATVGSFEPTVPSSEHC
jgi:hypothetical protein